MAAKDPTARRISAEGAGRARVAQADPAAMTAVRQAGAAATNAPVALARRIVKAWPNLDPADRAEVLAVLDQIRPRRRAQ